MPEDKLTEMYNDFLKSGPVDPTAMQWFQAGFTAAAVSMRTRAMEQCDKHKNVNDIKNGIGSLPDIPQ